MIRPTARSRCVVACDAAAEPEIDASSGGYRSKHMAVRKRADDLHGIGGRQQPLAAQYGAELLDAFGGPMREVCQRSVLGLAGLAVAFTQQDRWW